MFWFNFIVFILFCVIAAVINFAIDDPQKLNQTKESTSSTNATDNIDVTSSQVNHEVSELPKYQSSEKELIDQYNAQVEKYENSFGLTQEETENNRRTIYDLYRRLNAIGWCQSLLTDDLNVLAEWVRCKITDEAEIKPTSVEKLITQFDTSDLTCRGGRGDDINTQAACDSRDNTSKELFELGWCKGENQPVELSNADQLEASSWARCKMPREYYQKLEYKFENP